MIKNLEVENFKSIKHLKLECKRVNLFIGKPNGGKSNILEVLGLLSHTAHGNIRDFIRFETMSDLFHDKDIEKPIKTKFDENTLQVRFEGRMFKGEYLKQSIIPIFNYNIKGEGGVERREPVFDPIKFYRFSSEKGYEDKTPGFLQPPWGGNLFMIIRTRSKLREALPNIFTPFGLKGVYREDENIFEIQREKAKDIVIAHPYSLISDTLQRLIFHLAAIYSNEGSVLAFEEPEAHAFPYYTKYLAEVIASNRVNQFFISTHNPYFLLSLIEKTPKNEIGIYLTDWKEYQTKVKPLIEKDMQKILEMESDVFFNLDRFLEEK